MPRKFVDLSIYLENDVLSYPPAFAPGRCCRKPCRPKATGLTPIPARTGSSRPPSLGFVPSILSQRVGPYYDSRMANDRPEASHRAGQARI